MISSAETAGDALTVANVLWQATEQLQHAAENPKFESEILLCAILEKPRSHLRAHPEKKISATVAKDFQALVTQRAIGRPIAYLLGTREFWSRPFKVSCDTLIPRPETELLVEQTLAILPKGRANRILDLGTGSGIIAITLLLERPENHLTAIELSGPALTIARENARCLGALELTFLNGNWFEPLKPDDAFDVIVSNPPYIAENDPHLAQGDLVHEPALALASGPDGLFAIRHIIAGAPSHLKPGGTLLLEHGFDQADEIARLMTNAGYRAIEQFKDLQGHTRVSKAQFYE